MRTMVWTCLLDCGFGPHSKEGVWGESVEISTGRQRQLPWVAVQGGTEGRKGGLGLGIRELLTRGC